MTNELALKGGGGGIATIPHLIPKNCFAITIYNNFSLCTYCKAKQQL